MNKIDIRKRNGVTILCLHSRKKQQINQSELEALKSRRVAGLLPATAHLDGNKFILVYDITHYLSLRDYLRTPIEKKQFVSIVEQFSNILHSMREQGFNTKNLLLDFNYVMIHATAQTIAFLFVPIQYYDNQTPIKTLFLDIAYNAAFSQAESMEYVRDYITIIQRGVNFSEYELDEYIKKLKALAHPEGRARPDDSSVGGGVSPEENPDAYLVDGVVRVYDGLGAALSQTAPANPFLVRLATGARIPIDQAAFRLGRSPSKVDFAISDNRAISGYHALISAEPDGRYYITDQGSLNHTYVNGQELPGGEKREITAGTRIELADEAFIFEYSG